MRVNVSVHGHVRAGERSSLTFADGLSHLFASLPAGSRGDVRRDRALPVRLLLTGKHTTGHTHVTHNERPSNVKTDIFKAKQNSRLGQIQSAATARCTLAAKWKLLEEQARVISLLLLPFLPSCQSS